MNLTEFQHFIRRKIIEDYLNKLRNEACENSDKRCKEERCLMKESEFKALKSEFDKAGLKITIENPDAVITKDEDNYHRDNLIAIVNLLNKYDVCFEDLLKAFDVKGYKNGRTM